MARHADVQGCTLHLFAAKGLEYSTDAATQCLANVSAVAVPVLKPGSESCQARRQYMRVLDEDECGNACDAHLSPPLHRCLARCRRLWTQSATA